MRRFVMFIVLLLAASVASAQKEPGPRTGNEPVEPFRIIANIYYVGASDVASYLVATPRGHILIDGGYEETAPLILANIRKLGFELKDVGIILNTHAHYDHAGGIPMIKDKTASIFMASEGDAPLLERGGRDDPQFGDAFPFPPIKPDRLLREGDRVALGGSILTAHMTPGHTPGCTTWTVDLRERMKTYHIVIVGSPIVPPQYKLIGNPKYPDAVADYRKQFATLKSLPCDVFLGSHGSFFDLQGKAARLAKGARPNPFIDPEGYKRFVAASEAAFEDEVKKEQASQ